MTPGELADRRQRAIEAACDQHTIASPGVGLAIELAVETATRVQVTPELLRVAQSATECDPAECDPCIERALIAAFRAAGFEVEE